MRFCWSRTNAYFYTGVNMEKGTNEYFGDEDEPKQGYNGYFFDLEEEGDNG